MRNRAWRELLLALVVCVAIFPTPSDAHLMPAQRGTLNFLGTGGFMVLSLPVSAFSGIDTNGDKRLSQNELSEHRPAIVASIVRNVKLSDSNGSRPLEGIMLSLSPAADGRRDAADQLVAMGRFILAQDMQARPEQQFSLGIDLFGTQAHEQSYSITASRDQRRERHLIRLSPEQPAREFFPSQIALFSQFAIAGAQHILSGLDHLLFLLVVIAGSIGWRGKLLVLTAFTIGHAITLTLSVLDWVSLPLIIVEPAIAATIVTIAIFDLRTGKSAHRPAPWGRLCLVFSCALIHGLGLASGMSDLGLQNENLLVSLAGFNVGIELAQIVVVALAGATMFVLASFAHRQSVLNLSTRAVSLSAVTLGSFWLVTRVVELG